MRGDHARSYDRMRSISVRACIHSGRKEVVRLVQSFGACSHTIPISSPRWMSSPRSGAKRRSLKPARLTEYGHAGYIGCTAGRFNSMGAEGPVTCTARSSDDMQRFAILTVIFTGIAMLLAALTGIR